jgi:hypothetical protein
MLASLRGNKERIGGQFESLIPVRLQTERPPNTPNRGMRQPVSLAMERMDQWGAPLVLNAMYAQSLPRPDRPKPCAVDPGGTRPFSGIFNALSGSGQPFDTIPHEPAPPFANSMFMNAHMMRNFLALKPLGTKQDHPATVR